MTDEKILDIIQNHYLIENASLEFLRESGGKVYIVHGERKYLLKIMGKAFSYNAKEAVKIMCYLEENGFLVPKTILTKNGEPFLEFNAEGEEHLIVVQKYIKGDEPDLEKSASKVGALVGRFHTLMEQYQGDTAFRDKFYFIDKYVGFLKEKESHLTSSYKELGDSLWEKVKELPCGICHGDLHRGNLIETSDGEIYLIDLDTVSREPFMFDISVMCDMTDYFRLDPEEIKISLTVFDRFVKGYEEYRVLSQKEKNIFPYWVAIRHFQLQAVMIEIHGLNCNDERFDEWQLEWLRYWLNSFDYQEDIR